MPAFGRRMISPARPGSRSHPSRPALTTRSPSVTPLLPIRKVGSFLLFVAPVGTARDDRDASNRRLNCLDRRQRTVSSALKIRSSGWTPALRTYAAPGLGVASATVEAPEQSQTRPGFRRGPSNLDAVAIGTACTRRWCAQEWVVREFRSRRPWRAAQGKPLRACEIAAPGSVDEATPNPGAHTRSSHHPVCFASTPPPTGRRGVSFLPAPARRRLRQQAAIPPL